MPSMTIVARIALIAGFALPITAVSSPTCAQALERARLKAWPQIKPVFAENEADEAKIAAMVKAMPLRRKIAQMTQVEIKAVTVDQMKAYQFGSILNGGGSWPQMNKHATAQDWVDLADRFYDVSEVPPLWGTDAVHGHSNVYGATLFPHNIGLGAAHDPELIGEIGAATAKAVRATGINWAFAPTLALVENQRWGRSYEGFSSDPTLVRSYAIAYTKGLQGDLTKHYNVVATAKHYLGDGGTYQGVNEGVTRATEADLIAKHAQGYFGALGAGVQTVMASYSSWSDLGTGTAPVKMHLSHYLLTDVLKTRMGFDGLVVSDWDALGKVPGCTNSHCPAAINAGIDVVMVPFEWQAFIDQTVADVENGAIAQSRIDDAVTRILRVKMRAHLFGQRPSANPLAAKQAALTARELGRRAVAESLVLLKNDHSALPLRPGGRVLVVGKSADNLPNQSGGWTLTWQGTESSNIDFPNADSLLTAIRAANGKGQVTYSLTGTDVDLGQFDTVIAVIGEAPYAETAGDLTPKMSMTHSDRYPEDLAVLKAVSGKGKPVITLFESGRTVYANDLLNLSDAFVAAWLPGSEGKGVTDVLFADPTGKVVKDFKGRLAFGWPGQACAPAAMPTAGSLFTLGYGLSYAHHGAPLGVLPDPVLAKGC